MKLVRTRVIAMEMTISGGSQAYFEGHANGENVKEV